MILLLGENGTLKITQQLFRILYGSDVLGNSANMRPISNAAKLVIKSNTSFFQHLGNVIFHLSKL